MCTEPLGELSKPLPYSHCAQSHLICALSGKVMDDNNPPMALPNGYVYGENVSLCCGLNLLSLMCDDKMAVIVS